MFRRVLLPCLVALGCLLFSIRDRVAVANENLSTTTASRALTFEKHIRPILKTHCFQCHGEQDHREGKLDLRLKRLIVQGGESGSALAINRPDDSLLIKRIRAGEMPPNGKTLPEKDLRQIEQWISEGAPTARDEPQDLTAMSDIAEEERSFWSFQPVRRPAIPADGTAAAISDSRHADSAKTPVDSFLLEQLHVKGLGYSPEAARATLVRRLTFNLLGLPPSPQEVTEFVSDPTPDAFERLADRLMASPHYGERWGRHWLDVAGYADSEGYTETDPIRKYSYKYRDWVIRAMNADKPFNEFVVEQLAGDELVKPPHLNLTAEQQDLLIATGFLRTVADGTEQGSDPKIARNAVVAETIKVTSTALLGLTVGCAECHNHRYDPIPQADYYRFRALFEPALNWKDWRTPTQRLISLYTDADRAEAAAVEAEAKVILDEREKKLNAAIEVIFERELAKVPEDKRDAVKTARNTKDAERTPDQIAILKSYPSADPKPYQIDLYDPTTYNELKKDEQLAAEVRKRKPMEDFVSPLTEVPGRLPETVLFYRGDPDQPKQALSPGELSVLDWLPPLVPATSDSIPTSGRRLAYARHLTSGRHPLISRVLVNRLWAAHFGRGLVATPGDFGVLGDRPTHPALLDWLASEFVCAGLGQETIGPRWSQKRLHRLIIGSYTYQQSSSRSATADAVDPDNRLLGRMPVRRLEAEVVRDSIHSVNGTINPKLGGSPVPVMLDEDGQVVIGIENLNGENRPGEVIPLHGEEYRRSVYVQVRRSRPLAVLEMFDLATLDPNCTLRNSSTVAPQSLLLMNSDFVLRSAKQLSQRLLEEAGSGSAERIRYAWPLLFGRPSREDEIEAAVRFLDEEKSRLTDAAGAVSDPKLKPDPDQWAWSAFCQALLGSNEFLYVD